MLAIFAPADELFQKVPLLVGLKTGILITNGAHPEFGMTWHWKLWNGCECVAELHCRDKFLYLSAYNVLIISDRLADRYKNLSLQCGSTTHSWRGFLCVIRV